MPISQSDTSRPYWRGVMLRPDFGLVKRNSPGFFARDLEVVVDGLACLLGQLKPNWSPGLSLTHRRSINCVTIGSNIIDRNCDYVAAPQFTVDGKIEHRQVTFTPLNLEHGANCPDVLLPERRLGSN